MVGAGKTIVHLEVVCVCDLNLTPRIRLIDFLKSGV